MAINKVQKADGTVLIDLTNDTVDANSLLQGATAHDRSGNQIQGAVVVAPIDDTTTANNKVWSSSKTSDELADKVSYEDNGILGAKNWLNHKITSRVVDGIIVTVNADTKAITLNGTSSADGQIQENVRDIFLAKGTYQYSGALNGDNPIGDLNECFTYLNHINNVSSWKARSSETVEERQFTITDDSYGITFGIYYKGGVTFNNLTFYPMIRLVSDTDPTYQLYSKTNGQLTNDVQKINSELDDWTSTSTVQSDNTVTFSGLNDNYGYKLCCENKLIGISAMTKTGSGTNVTLVFTVTGASAGDVCKLRILK